MGPEVQMWHLGGLEQAAPCKEATSRSRWDGTGKRKVRVEKAMEDRAGSHRTGTAASCVRKAVVSYEGSCPG